MRWIVGMTLVLGLSCGGSEVRCGEGTTLRGKTCVAESQCGPGTATVDGKCVVASVARIAEATAALAELADRICKCKTEECSDRLMSELQEFGRKYDSIRDEDFSPAQREEVMKIASRIGECARSMPVGAVGAKTRTTEATQMVKKLYDGARAYYMDGASGAAALGGANTAAQFPEPSAGPVPPLGTCCKEKGRQCQPAAQLWTDEVWVALQFSVDDPHYYSYEYKVDNEAKDGPTFTVSAYGDLDCDGVYSTFRMTGVVNSEYADGPAGTAAIFKDNELE